MQIVPLTEPVLAPPAEENWEFAPLAESREPARRSSQASAESRPDDGSERGTPAAASNEGIFFLPRRAPGLLTDDSRANVRFLDGPQDRHRSSDAAASRKGVLESGRRPERQPEEANRPFLRFDTTTESATTSQQSTDELTVDLPTDAAAEQSKDSGTDPESALALVPGRLFPDDEPGAEFEENLDLGDNLWPAEEPHSTSELEQETTIPGTPMQQIVTRDGMGLKGFCPVALRDQRKLKDGLEDYTSHFNGRKYRLSSAAAKAAFDDEPEKYAPVEQGIDVTLAAITGEVRPGSLDHAVWYKDRLYLFATSENLKTFMAMPSAMNVSE